jgi:hypothetical protein
MNKFKTVKLSTRTGTNRQRLLQIASEIPIDEGIKPEDVAKELGILKESVVRLASRIGCSVVIGQKAWIVNPETLNEESEA